MSQIFGHLNISDSDYVYQSTVGQTVIWNAVQDYLTLYNTELLKATGLFVEMTTSNFKERYKLPGGGYLQRRNSDGSYANVKAIGQWDVAYPLEDFGAAIGGNDVDMAYMTVAELDRHILTVTQQNINTVRYEMLRRLFNNTAWSFVDPLHGTLSVAPLANGDGTLYPPVLGSETEADDTHQLETNYAYTAIDDTNNPLVTIRNELEEHFGVPAGGSNIAVFINQAETPYIEDLADFTEIVDRFVRPSVTTDTPFGFPPNLPGTVLGRSNGVWVVEWRVMPAHYLLGIHLDVPKPLKMRVDPPAVGLGTGLQLLTPFAETEFPFRNSYWRHRFGFGVGNRLNGVVLECGTGGTYTVPTGY